MKTITTIPEVRRHRTRARAAAQRVCLVPTMGFLHQGHLSLVRRGRELADTVWVSIFVNPTQFGPNEDLDRYPRDLARDCELLSGAGAELVFAPAVEEMYPRPALLQVAFSGLEQLLCGTDRPGHFAGVGLVVCKLFNIVEPEVAVFGQKDAQQALLIRRLAADLNFSVEIEVAPTVREPDGLAMSSRNAYLDEAQRSAAPVLYRALCEAQRAVQGGLTDPSAVRALVRREVAGEAGVRLEYAECVSAADLNTPEVISGPVLIAVAARLGSTRLIDNVIADPEAGG